ncbi:MAG: hypothetical protein WC992_08960 [Acholeplasmataceae bacterium]
MKEYGTNTRHLMDALTVMGLRVKELEIREAVGEVRTVKLVAQIADGYYNTSEVPKTPKEEN